MTDGDPLHSALVEALSTPVVLVDDRRRVVLANRAAHLVLDKVPVTCCEFACGALCLSRAVLSAPGQPAQEALIEARGVRWSVEARPLPGYRLAVLQLTAAGAHARPDGDVLEVQTLGGLALTRAGLELDGEWLTHRPGQVLKYLLAAPGHSATVDDLIDALWPSATSSAAAMASVRQAVHALRRRLEPDGRGHGESSFVLSQRNGYALDVTRLRLDTTDFERLARRGATAADVGDWDRAEPLLEQAAACYRGEFLADDRYADWALSERERLRALAGVVLRTLADIQLRAGRLAEGSHQLDRLSDLDPLDLDVQRELLSVMLQRGRHGDAARRYELVRHRFRRAFGEEPGFKLAELAPPR